MEICKTCVHYDDWMDDISKTCDLCVHWNNENEENMFMENKGVNKKDELAELKRENELLKVEADVQAQLARDYQYKYSKLTEQEND